MVRPQKHQREAVHRDDEKRLGQGGLQRPGAEGIGHRAQQRAEPAVFVVQAEGHKGQPRQVNAQQHQKFQQLLAVLAGYKGGQQVERVAHDVIAQCGDDVVAVADAHIPGGDGRAGNQAAGGLPQPAAVIDQRRVMLLDAVGIPDEGFAVGRKNGNPHPGQQNEQGGKGQPQRDGGVAFGKAAGPRCGGCDLSHTHIPLTGCRTGRRQRFCIRPDPAGHTLRAGRPPSARRKVLFACPHYKRPPCRMQACGGAARRLTAILHRFCTRPAVSGLRRIVFGRGT